MKTRSKFFHKLLTAYAFLALLPGALFAQAWIARHGLSPSQYQTEFNTHTANGYRLTSVNGYTENGAEKYIALWEKVSGNAYVTKHSMTSSEYQAAFNTYTSQGYVPTLVSGYAVGGVAQFAAIWEKKSGVTWFAKHNLTAAQYQAVYDTYTSQGYRPRYISGYVVNGVEYFAGIWEKVTGVTWVARHNLTAAQYQSAFNTYTNQGYVLKCISGYNKNGVDLYAAVWEKKSAPLWSARHGITAANYQHVFDNHYYTGYRPVLLNAFASGTSAKFNGFWTNTNITSSNMAKIDDAINNYMTSQGLSGLSIAVSKNGRLVFAKGYGKANASTGEEMSPNQPGRIMSISKPLTSVGIMTLIQKGLLSKESLVFGRNGILGSKYSTPANKPSLNRIRVRHLLNHTSGLRSCNGETVFWDASKNPDDAMAVLLAANDLVLSDTSVAFVYSNTNYFILERIIEQVSGKKYETYIRENVLNKCGIGSTMYVGQANGNPRAGEMNYTPLNKMNLQLWAGFGGWVARPIDLLKFLNRVDGAASPSDIITAASHTTMTTGSTLSPGYAFGWNVSGSLQNHNGCHGSSRSFLVELANGLSYAVIVNDQPTDDGCGWKMKSAIEAGLNQVTAWPSYNLFDNIGPGARADEFAITAEEQGFNINMEASYVNKVLAYPTVSTDGVINFTNAEGITSITVTDMLGNKETHKAVDRIQTQLKGMLLLLIETESGQVTQKIIVE
jgi:CubicO group peptidase (beta-lactamase class C family)